MNKSNIHKKTTFMDHFGRKWFCKRAAVNVARDCKKTAKKLRRRQIKAETKDEMGG